MRSNNKLIEELLQNKKIAMIGYANLLNLDKETRNGFKYGISIGIALKVFPSTTEDPSISYYNEYKNVTNELKEISFFLADEIKKRGYNAESLVEVKQNEEFRTKLPFKTIATLAGLGWIGKSAALVTKKYGNAIRLNGILTDMPIDTGIPITESLCNNCEECVKNCPGKAITGKLWNIGIDRDELLDAHECKNTAIKRGKLLNVMDGSCGIYLAVCPYTIKYRKTILKLNN